MFKAEGLITPVVTALTEKEEFNKKEYQAFIDHLIKAGVHGIFPLGTNGEFYAFSFKEKLEIIEAAVEAVQGRVPVYAGTQAALRQKKRSKCRKRFNRWAVSIACPSLRRTL